MQVLRVRVDEDNTSVHFNGVLFPYNGLILPWKTKTHKNKIQHITNTITYINPYIPQ